jgi:trimethylamine--corrinoid protein Co-methyltransferase
MADAKVPDNQSGYEKALTVALAAMAGPDFVYESAGMLAGLLGCSLEAMVIDDEMISSIRRTMRGIEVNADTISTDLIDDTARGIGHFLGTVQTMSLMESEYVYPILGDRLSPDDWAEKGSHDIWDRAADRVKAILAEPAHNHISAEADAAVRKKYPIKLA